MVKHLPAGALFERDGRYFFTDDRTGIEIPHLIETQLDSWKWFLEQGLWDLFQEITPIKDATGSKLELHFLSHSIGTPKWNWREAKEKNLTYDVPLTVRVQLINKETGEIKEQDIFFGGIPSMTERGTFIVNGNERVVIAQIQRSPGVLYMPSAVTQGYFSMKFIPRRGVWLEVETDKDNTLTIKIDRRRKILLTTFIKALGVESVKDILKIFAGVAPDPSTNQADYILNTLEHDDTKTRNDALIQIYRKVRPGDLATADNALQLINQMFFDFRRYDLGKVGRYKINSRLSLNVKNDIPHRIFQMDDFIAATKGLISMNHGLVPPDEVDSLTNRRIRSVGELVQDAYRNGLLRVERIARDRMTMIPNIESATPQQLINSHPITAVLREFFAAQLAQFMDQNNPLAELAHKRRLSALGPGGITRERASIEVRDVHESHYGRICPIETPEGPNIGLVVHLATFAKINEYGFLETPYRKITQKVPNDGKSPVGHLFESEEKEIKNGKKTVVKNGDEINKKIAVELKELSKKYPTISIWPVLSDEITYYDAGAEANLVIAQANAAIEANGRFATKIVAARRHGHPVQIHIKELTHIDVSPKQVVSVTSALIPFMASDENARALMGANHQRQAVPLLKTKAPLIGTGMERKAAYDSGQVLLAPEDGEITAADGKQISLVTKKGQRLIFDLVNFSRSNSNTLVHQKPAVFRGQKVKKGHILANGAAIDDGELALGQDLLVAYMPWHGFNYEDAVIISERVVRDSLFDSIHIEDHEIDVRDTKLGEEQITRDIPNVSDERLRNLNEDGIIQIGAEVREGDILIGKITPKGETELTPEERLLRAIFGEKAHDVKDTSLRMPAGESGKVIGVRIFTRRDEAELPQGVLRRVVVFIATTRKINIGDKLAGRHGNKGVISKIVPVEDMPYLPDGTPIDVIFNPMGVISRLNMGQLYELHAGWAVGKLGIKIATPTLNDIKSDQIRALLKDAGLPEDGMIHLIDGRSGDKFDYKTTVGWAYIMKLIHIADEKIHARSIGPYSLITQQPLGGKAHHGGQRFGEMEVWALEAYAANHTLQEMLTIKSDDTYGRSKAYEAIIKGEDIKQLSVPEGFKVLVRELRACGLDVDLIKQGRVYDEATEEHLLSAELDEEVLDPVVIERMKELETTDEEDLSSGDHENDAFAEVIEDGLEDDENSDEVIDESEIKKESEE
ncbi:MAG: DNA-directed RNA polymerase subunit beta [Patescibacteria group bacterium]|nr:DNA-directed RNA polymerase subunit beta [Patescibacteria group bacterium]